MKQCPRCWQLLPLDAFARNRSTKDGLASYCRACFRNYRATNAARLLRCPRCDRVLAAEAFAPSQRTQGSWCRECFNDYHSQPDVRERRQVSAARRAERRARADDSLRVQPFGPQLPKLWHTWHGYVAAHMPWHPLASRTGAVLWHRAVLWHELGHGPHACAFCGRALSWFVPFSDLSYLTVEHVNGKKQDNEPGNLAPCCVRCNLRRQKWRAHDPPPSSAHTPPSLAISPLLANTPPSLSDPPPSLSDPPLPSPAIAIHAGDIAGISSQQP